MSDRKEKLEEVRKHQFLLPHSNCVHFYQSWEDNGRLYQKFELCQKSLMDVSEEKHDLPESLVSFEQLLYFKLDSQKFLLKDQYVKDFNRQFFRLFGMFIRDFP